MTGNLLIMLVKGGDTMIRKIVFSLICLIFSGMSVFATHIIMTDHALLTVPKSADLSAHVDFHEGKRLVRFAGGKMYGGDAVRFMCIKKGNTWKPDKVWWSNSAQGWAYQMKDCVKTLKKEHIFQSMLRKDNCLDKSVAAISLLHLGLTYWGHYIKKRCLRATALFDYECY
jgi:hypothetical protein